MEIFYAGVKIKQQILQQGIFSNETESRTLLTDTQFPLTHWRLGDIKVHLSMPALLCHCHKQGLWHT